MLFGLFSSFSLLSIIEPNLALSVRRHTALSAGQPLLEEIGGKLVVLRQCRVASALEVDALSYPQWFDIPLAP